MMLQMFPIFVHQLKGYLALEKTPEELEYLKADIRGYEAIIESKSDSNARWFMQIKNEQRRLLEPTLKNNEEIVNHMKSEGLWENGT